MNDGKRILEWARQNDHSLTWMATRMGYPCDALEQALQSNCISAALAQALFAYFGLRVAPTIVERDACSYEPGWRPEFESRLPPECWLESSSCSPEESEARLLDPHHDAIVEHLNSSSVRRLMAKLLDLDESEVQSWMNRRIQERQRRWRGEPDNDL